MAVEGARSRVSFREFAAERFIQSSWTQKQKCKAFKNLSIGFNFIEIDAQLDVHFQIQRWWSESAALFNSMKTDVNAIQQDYSSR